MVKKKKTKNVKKEIKNKNINIKIHIDQSKKTTGSNAKKSNIKTLPAYSAAPSSGGNYIRQFVQDPYYSQSQYEQMNLLKQYNNLVKQNNPQILDSEKDKNKNFPKITNEFKDKNQNDQQLITPEQALVHMMNDSTINREYKIDEDSSYLDREDDSIQGRVLNFKMNDDPRTNGEPENMLVRKQTFQQLPYNDLNTRDELLIYDKNPDVLKIEDGKLTTPQADLKSESKSLLSRATPPTEPHPDKIFNALISKDEFLNGKKVIRDDYKDLREGKIFNKVSGLWVNPNNEEYKQSVKNKSDHLYYTTNLYEINKKIQEVREGHENYNQNWARYNQAKKRAVKKPKMIVEEKEDSDNDPDEIFIVNKGTGNALSDIVQSALPPPPPIVIKTRSKAKEEDDNKSTTSMLSRVSAIFTPSVSKEAKTVEEKPVKFKPKALEPKVDKSKKNKSAINKVGIA